jgi:hypothetical protein
MYNTHRRLLLGILLSTIPILSKAHVPDPIHREIVIRAFQLAVDAGFADSNLDLKEIQARLEAGAYSEDFERIPGIAGDHFPNPWDQTPSFDFLGFIPMLKIPYGSPVDPHETSGWHRGLPHGYDPVQNYTWPGTETTTVGWSNFPVNAYTWDAAVKLYVQGNIAQAYQCLGHVLHLLADLSVPSHVKVVNHGATNFRKRSGNPIDPDLIDIIIDEYETALSGGLVISNNTIIPNLFEPFRNSLTDANVSNIPDFSHWTEYLEQIALITYNLPDVDSFYVQPSVNGEYGHYRNQSGELVEPQFYGGTPVGLVDGRVTQFFPYTTVQIPGGTILPESIMVTLCQSLVSRAVEYSAGLILKFLDEVHEVTTVEDISFHPKEYYLFQNYPNPFNPSTVIRYELQENSFVSLKVFNMLGKEVATLVDGEKKAGVHIVTFSANGLPSGVYYYRLQAGEFSETKKLLLMK